VVAATPHAQTPSMNTLAERYVRLVLAVGQHDADYVDAFYGPADWRKEAESAKLPLAEIETRAATLAKALSASPVPSAEIEKLRREYLIRQLDALRAKVRMLSGGKFRFDEESKALYDAVAPTQPASAFESILAELDKRLPGSGSLIERYEAFRSRYVIPRDRLDATFKAAIEGCRERTLKYISLPKDERFTVEYVTNKSWSGYNWYQGNHRSVIQVNTDLPIYVDRAIDLACHEGYPGHHVYNVLLEQRLVQDRGWIEFTVYPLFSPQSLIAEGTANYGIDVAFPRAERIEFERRVIFPAAGLNPADAQAFYDVMALTERISYAGNEAARQYIDGQIDAKGAADWLERYGLYPRPRAEQRVRFIDQYRSYVINYNLGKDLVARYIESQVGVGRDAKGPATVGRDAQRPAAMTDAAARWKAFEQLISSPRLPSGLR
jgi:hypothetical protein